MGFIYLFAFLFIYVSFKIFTSVGKDFNGDFKSDKQINHIIGLGFQENERINVEFVGDKLSFISLNKIYSIDKNNIIDYRIMNIQDYIITPSKNQTIAKTIFFGAHGALIGSNSRTTSVNTKCIIINYQTLNDEIEIILSESQTIDTGIVQKLYDAIKIKDKNGNKSISEVII